VEGGGWLKKTKKELRYSKLRDTGGNSRLAEMGGHINLRIWVATEG
jgi:hypothetical protein